MEYLYRFNLLKLSYNVYLCKKNLLDPVLRIE